MLRKICSIIIVTLVLSSIALGYSGGEGTEGSPYLISSAADIESLGNTTADWGKYFEVTQDIDLAGYSNIRIGTSSIPFSGYFDGSGKTISNYTFTNAVDYGALFGYINASAVIEGVKMTNVSVNTGSGKYAAALVGNNYGIVEGCTAAGSVSAGNYSGGLVARNYGTIENCGSSVSVTSMSRGGCLTSYNSVAGSISKCLAMGSVTGYDRVGGIVGENIGNVSNCYSGASATGTEKVGGIAGSTATGSITNSYSYGEVVGTLYKGAFIGDRVSGAVSGCFYDSETTYPLLGVGRGASTGTTGKTTALMQTESTFTDAGWDFGSTWWIAPASYPSLESEEKAKVIRLEGSLDFGGIDIGESAQASFTIYNEGNSDLTVTEISYPEGFSGPWSGIIEVGMSQVVTVTFAPTLAQVYGGTITVSSDMTGGQNTIECAGIGTIQTRIIAINGNLTFGDVDINSTSQKTITIQNTGNSPLTVTGISYPAGFSGNWSGTVAADGGTQDVVVSFAPTAARGYGGTATVNSNATGGVNTKTVSGNGIGAVIRVTSSLNFGNVFVGDSVDRTLIIYNDGNTALNVSGITYPYSEFTGAWSGAIAAGASKAVTVTFAPVLESSYNGTIAVVSDAKAGGSQCTVTAAGVIERRTISLAGNLVFDDTIVGQTSQRTLTISNTGNSPLDVSSITYPDMLSGSFSGTIAAGGFEAVTITFAPTIQGNYGGPITVNSNATSGSDMVLSWGVGVERAIRLSGDMAFGKVDVNTTATAVLTIHNDGNRAMNVSGINYPAGFSGSFSGSIAAGGSQAVTVTFAPTSEQNYSGMITVASDKTTGNNSIACSGIGGGGVIVLSGDMSFGDIDAGLTSNSTLTISNNGTNPMTVSAINYPAGFSGNWSGGEIAAGASQNVVVTFAPSAAYIYIGSITVVSNATSGTSAIECSGEGVTREIAVSGDLNFGDVDVNGTSQKTFTITNNGNRPLNVTNIFKPDGFSVDWSSGQIAAGAAKVVTVTLAPTAVELYIGTIVVISDATSGDNTIAAFGEGVSRVISVTGSLGFGDVDVSSSSQLVLTITNSGIRDLNVASISYPDGFSGNWSGTVAANGGTQNVNVTFAPTAAQSYSGTITVNADATSGSNTIECSGVGIGGVIRLSGSLSFASVNVDDTAQLEFAIHNDGTGSMEVSGINYPAGFTGSFSGTIAAGASQAVVVTFAPTAAQSYGGTVAVGSDAVSGVNTIECSGIGSGGIIRLAGNMVFAETVTNQTSTRILTIYNDGTGPLAVSGISYSDSAFSGNWSGTIAAGASKAVTVTFAPTAADSFSGDITVSSDATSGINVIACSGQGISRGISLSLSTAVLGDTDVNTLVNATLVIQNTGNRTLTVSGISYPAGFSGNWSSGTIAAGATKNITVTFAPTAAQSYGGDITVASNKTEGTNTIAITGYGVTRIVNVSGDLWFGLASIGQTPSMTMTIQNTGNRAMTVGSISYPAGFSGNWSGGTVAAGASKDVIVTFAPTEAKTYSGTVTVETNATSGNNTVECFGFVFVGDGSAGNPYQISTDYHLDAVNEDLTACYILMSDVNISGATYSSAVIAADEVIATINFDGEAFTGTFDGNGFSIIGLRIDTADTMSHYLGLFGNVGIGANITNLGVTNVNITTGNDSRFIGGVCGYNAAGFIANSYSTGIIAGDVVTISVGGLSGYNGGLIVASCSAANVAGGSSSLDTGGLCGTNEGIIADCYSAGIVIGQSYVGGLCGYNYYGNIFDSYSRGDVSGNDFVGGLCGHDYNTIFSSFWDMQTSGMPTSAGGTGLMSAAMMDIATFINAGWDFVGETANGTNDTWTKKNGDYYPTLSWQTYATADINSDMLVNELDLIIIAGDWLEEAADLAGDINNDGVVNLLDFAAFAVQWNESAQ